MSNSGFLWPLNNAPIRYHLTDCLTLMWFVLLDPYSDRSHLIYYSDFNPFMSADLSGVRWVILSELRALLASPRVVPYGRVVMKSNTDDHPLSCE